MGTYSYFSISTWNNVCKDKCTYSFTKNSDLKTGVATEVQFTPVDGKTWDGTDYPKITIYTNSGSLKYSAKVLSSGKVGFTNLNVPSGLADNEVYLSNVNVIDATTAPTASMSYSFTNKVQCSPQPTEYVEGEEVDFVLTVAEGWRFTEAPYFSYVDNQQITQQINGVLDEDGKYHINVSGISIYDGSTATIFAFVESKPAEVPVVYNLVHSSCSPAPSTVQIGQDLSITVIADSGYKFDSNSKPELLYVKDGISLALYGTFSESSVTFAISPFQCDLDSEVTINAVAVASGNEDFSCPISYETQNVILSSQPSEIQNGGDLSITISTVDIDKYYFDESDRCYVEYTNSDGESVIVYAVAESTPYSRYLLVENISLKPDTEVKVYAKAYGVYATFDYSGIRNCTANPIYDVYDESFAETSHIQTFTANDGYLFNGEVSITGVTILGGTVRLVAQISTDRKSAQVTIPERLNLKRNSVLTANATAIIEEQQFKLSTIFVPTEEQVYQISKKRYYGYTNNDPTTLEQIDLGQYILSMRKMFVDVPIDAEQNIMLGFFNTGIVAKAFYGISFDVDCGVVEVVGLYQNSLDFTETTIEACLPFVGLKTLSASVVMNRRLRLVYTVNVSQGECVAKLYDEDAGILLYAFDGVCAYDIPYILEYSLGKQYQIPKGELSASNMALFHCEPSLTIRERDIVEGEEFFGDETAIFTMLDNLTGFNVVDEVELNSVVCLDDERKLLREVLAKGVYFNYPEGAQE